MQNRSPYPQIETTDPSGQTKKDFTSDQEVRWCPGCGDYSILAQVQRVLVPELNLGQLVKLVRAKYLVDARSYPKIQGKPFKEAEIVEAIRAQLEAH